MSEQISEGQESQAALSCHGGPSRSDSCRPIQDVLTSEEKLTFAIENEHDRRILVQRLRSLQSEMAKREESRPSETDYPQIREFFRKMKWLFAEVAQTAAGLEKLYDERTVQTTELYITISRLSIDELNELNEYNRTHTSSGQDSNRQLRPELAQGQKDHDDCHDRDCASDPQSSPGTKQMKAAEDYPYPFLWYKGRFYEQRPKVVKINDESRQSLQHPETANVSKTTNDAPKKAPKGLWKKILRLS